MPEPYDAIPDDPDADASADQDLWFIPGPIEEEPAFLAPLPRAEAGEGDQVAQWEQAQSQHALLLARVAARFGALDERLRQGPKGWRQRLALVEASELSWLTGDRISVDRLGLWQAMRISSVEDDTQSLQRISWAMRRLSGGPGPNPDLSIFLGRHHAETLDPMIGKIAAWQSILERTNTMHPLVRACFAFHLWPMSGIGPDGDLLEGAVVAGRLSASEGQGGALFAPILMAGGGLRTGDSDVTVRLRRWLMATEDGIMRAKRHLDQLDDWAERAKEAATKLSGRTPPRLIEVLQAWPYVTAPMAEELTGSSRAAAQRNLTWFERHGLVQEITGQGRFRVWRASV